MSLGTARVLHHLSHRRPARRAVRLTFRFCVCVWLLGSAVAAQASVSGQALVIGNGAYASLPVISGCVLSAHAIAAALRGHGFQVIERTDASAGAVDGALSDFARQLASAPGAPGFVYVCGYAGGLNGRPFLLPVTASLQRPTDLLTQGVLAKAMVDSLAGDDARPAVVVFDAVPAPGSSSPLGFDTFIQSALPAGMGVLAVNETASGDAPTPLAASLVSQLQAPVMQTGALLAGIQAQLQGSRTATVAALHPPDGQGFLFGAPEAPAAPAAAPTAGAAVVPPPAAPLQAEAQMTTADRRVVQAALAKLGYYDGVVDGVFGPETRAAIRRFQHELRATMTGQLTAEQLSRLQSGG